jgi:hypothetical protein
VAKLVRHNLDAGAVALEAMTPGELKHFVNVDFAAMTGEDHVACL